MRLINGILATLLLCSMIGCSDGSYTQAEEDALRENTTRDMTHEEALDLAGPEATSEGAEDASESAAIPPDKK